MGIFDLFKGKGPTQKPPESAEAGLPQTAPEIEETKTFRAKVEEKAQFASKEVRNQILGWAGTIEGKNLAILETISKITEPGQAQRTERDATDSAVVDEAIKTFSNILGKNFAPEAQYSINEGWDVPEESPAPIPDPQKRIREEVNVNVFKTQEENIFWLDTSTKYVQRNGKEEVRERNVIARFSEADFSNIRGRLKEVDERAADMISRMPQKVPVAV